jgi:peptidoglycan/LPS O-acetylase OafA/YrhL
MRTIYALGITLVCLPNLMGNKNIIYKILNYTPIRYIVRFTFAGYLIHMLVIEVVIASFYRSLDFNVQTIASVYAGCLCIIGSYSFLFRMFIEMPF